MNSRTFILLISLFVVIVIFSAKLFFDSKKEIKEEYAYYLKLEEKIKQTAYLRDKYKFNSSILRVFKGCDIKDTPQKVTINCKNIDKNRFTQISSIFKKNLKIDNFSITKDKDKINFTLGIFK